MNKEIVRNAKSGVVRTKSGIEFPVLQGNMNTDRLIDCFENISYGLYRHEYKKNFNGKITILLGFATFQEKNDETMKNFIARRFELEERALAIRGANPHVFTYQFCSPDEFGIIGMKMTFYEGTAVYVAYLPSGTEKPYNLGFDLIKQGFRTTVSLGDEEFTFNEND
ncbi:MAG: hypothetical protein R8G66_11300 [Cytophagales bacterium]|nr:hypothetical protein [Cytophagales bacterium]